MIVRVFEKAAQNITRDGADEALKRLKAEKPAGLDGAATECLKWSGGACGEWLVGMFSLCLSARRVPKNWSVACKVPLCTVCMDKDDPHGCGKN